MKRATLPTEFIDPVTQKTVTGVTAKSQLLYALSRSVWKTTNDYMTSGKLTTDIQALTEDAVDFTFEDAEQHILEQSIINAQLFSYVAQPLLEAIKHATAFKP